MQNNPKYKKPLANSRPTPKYKKPPNIRNPWRGRSDRPNIRNGFLYSGGVTPVLLGRMKRTLVRVQLYYHLYLHPPDIFPFGIDGSHEFVLAQSARSQRGKNASPKGPKWSPRWSFHIKYIFHTCKCMKICINACIYT